MERDKTEIHYTHWIEPVRFAGSCCAGHLAALSNDSFNLAAKLFAPFREQGFPLVCSADVLSRMLKEPQRHLYQFRRLF